MYSVHGTDCFEQYFDILIQQTPKQINAGMEWLAGSRMVRLDVWGSQGSDRQPGQICRYGYRINTLSHIHTHINAHTVAFKIWQQDALCPVSWDRMASEGHKWISNVTHWKTLRILKAFIVKSPRKINEGQRLQRLLSVPPGYLLSSLSVNMGFSLINYKTLILLLLIPLVCTHPSILNGILFFLAQMIECLFNAFASAHGQNIETLWHFGCPLSPGLLQDADKSRNELIHRPTFRG